MTVYNKQRSFLDIYSIISNIVGYDLVTVVRFFKCISIKASFQTNMEILVQAINVSYIGMNYII